MIREAHPVLQAFLGTLMTWAITALGASLVFVTKNNNRKFLDVCLGFAAGVMTAASFWSLLAPGIDMASESGLYGEDGQYAFGPTGIGFLLGAVFVAIADHVMDKLTKKPKSQTSSNPDFFKHKPQEETSISSTTSTSCEGQENMGYEAEANAVDSKEGSGTEDSRAARQDCCVEVIKDLDSAVTGDNLIANWRRILLLVLAITVHNIPEGLAVGVSFGAASLNKTESSSFENARSLAIGIGVQNFPEGIAVSLPLKACGYSNLRAFWYGQLSGMVEPISGILGAVAIIIFEPVLPYALAFAAGAMIYVVMDDIIPEGQAAGNGKWASGGAMVGFIIMMCLDVGLG